MRHIFLQTYSHPLLKFAPDQADSLRESGNRPRIHTDAFPASYLIQLTIHHLKQRDLHPIGVLQADVVIAPGSHHRLVDEGRAVGEEFVHGGVQVGHLQGKADLSAEAFPCFERVDGLGLGFVEEFEGGASHIEDERVTVSVVPNGGGFDAESVAVEFHRAFKVFYGECDTQFENGVIVCHIGIISPFF